MSPAGDPDEVRPSSDSSRRVSGPGSAPCRAAKAAWQRSAVCSASPVSPCWSCARIVARQARSCSVSSRSNWRAAARVPAGSRWRSSICSNSPIACSRSRFRSPCSQASSAGSVPFSSSSSTPSIGGRVSAWWALALRIRSASTEVSAGFSARVCRSTVITSTPSGDSASSSRCISWRSEARACSSERRLHSSSARRSRSTGRRPDSARMASRPRVLRPSGSTLSFASVSACIRPMRFSRSSTASGLGKPGLSVSKAPPRGHVSRDHHARFRQPRHRCTTGLVSHVRSSLIAGSRPPSEPSRLTLATTGRNAIRERRVRNTPSPAIPPPEMKPRA